MIRNNRIFLLFDIVLKEKIQIICLSVFFAVITVTSVISLQKFQAYYGIIEYSKMCGFDEIRKGYVLLL